ncbi:hypothetical protein GCM10010510_22480 [Streptomyces anandii JCM 4720]|nr:hypothetical protein GCM10010510_22480 [Streptomyces anandii JCM 4720]
MAGAADAGAACAVPTERSVVTEASRAPAQARARRRPRRTDGAGFVHDGEKAWGMVRQASAGMWTGGTEERT